MPGALGVCVAYRSVAINELPRPELACPLLDDAGRRGTAVPFAAEERAHRALARREGGALSLGQHQRSMIADRSAIGDHRSPRSAIIDRRSSIGDRRSEITDRKIVDREIAGRAIAGRAIAGRAIADQSTTLTFDSSGLRARCAQLMSHSRTALHLVVAVIAFSDVIKTISGYTPPLTVFTHLLKSGGDKIVTFLSDEKLPNLRIIR